MEQKIMGYLETLYKQNPASVGGQLPDEGIFYKETNMKVITRVLA